MYTSVLLVTLVWTLGSPLPYCMLLWVGLVMTFSVKLLYEEHLLMKQFPEKGNLPGSSQAPHPFCGIEPIKFVVEEGYKTGLS